MNDKKLNELLEGIKSKKCEIRFEKSFKQLSKIAEKQPEVLYPHWDYLVGLLDSENQNIKYIALFLLADLVKADKDNRFEKVFDKYFDIIYGNRLMAAMVVAIVSWKIVEAKPELEPKITDKLLAVDKSKANHKDTIKIKIMESFDKYFERAKNKQKILKFAEKYEKWESPRARKLGKEFLEKWGK